MGELNACQHREILHHQALDAGGSGRAIVDCPWFGFRQRNEFRDRVYRHMRCDGKHRRCRRKGGNRREFRHGIGHRRIDQRIENKGAVACEQQGMTVSFRLCYKNRTDIRVGAWAILNNDGLFPLVAEMWRNNAEQNVRRPTGAKRNHYANRLRGEIAGPRRGGIERQYRDAEDQGETQSTIATEHFVFPVAEWRYSIQELCPRSRRSFDASFMTKGTGAFCTQRAALTLLLAL